MQIGVTLAGFLSSAFGAVTFAKPLARLCSTGPGCPPALAATVAVLRVTVAVGYVTLVLGELAPKRIGLQRAEGVAQAGGRSAGVSREHGPDPVIWLLGVSTISSSGSWGPTPRRVGRP